jgi:glycosyltransferase involved in cell wall biosynthesis
MSMLPKGLARTVFFDANEPERFNWGRFRQALGTAIGVPVTRKLISRMRLLRALEDLDLNDFDLIWAEQPHIGRMFNTCRARTIVDFDDVTHRKLMRLMPLQEWSLERLHNYYAYRVYRKAELVAFRKYLRVIVCSKDDEDYLKVLGAGNVRVAPNGTAVARLDRSARIREPGTVLRAVFLGNMSGGPNVDAIKFFADQVLPRAKHLVGSFDVIGSKVSTELMHEYGDRVHFRGFVEDLGAALCEYDVMVVPIRFGSGTKLKVLDGMANGVPLVATPYGVEGLDLVDGVHALIASTPDEILAALERLARSADFCRELAMRAHDLARDRYSWEAIQISLGKELVDAAREAAGTA